ncbi:acyltransferase family-domain-containing protein [Entophlyctis helioformis]|nr:acyltransferase family-domain-containing protein [Entophlyctis helioformis]
MSRGYTATSRSSSPASSDTTVHGMQGVYMQEQLYGDFASMDKDTGADMPPSFVDKVLPLAVATPPEPAAAPASRAVKQPVASAGKLAHFDGLRGIVAMTVVYIHFSNTFSKELYDLIHFYQYRSCSVPMFFILSGRVISVSVLRSGNMRQLASAIIRRPFRLLIPLMVVTMMDYLFFQIKSIPSLSSAITAPIFFMFNDGSRDLLAGPAWTLGIEYLGSNVVYFLTFFLIQFPNNPRARYTILGVAFCWYQLTCSWNTHFVIGLAFADLAQHGYMARFKAWRFAWVVQLFLAVIGVAVSFKIPFLNWNLVDAFETIPRSYQIANGVFGIPESGWNPHLQIMIYCSCFMFLLETVDWMQWFYTLAPFQFFGHISFAIYLFHDYWIGLFRPFPFVDMLTTDRYLFILTSVVLWSLPLLIFSYLLVDVIDMPSVKVGRWLERIFITEPWDGSLNTLFKFEAPKPAAKPSVSIFSRITAYLPASVRPLRSTTLGSISNFLAASFPERANNTTNTYAQVKPTDV